MQTLSIKAKLLLAVGLCGLFITGSLIGYQTWRTRKLAIENAQANSRAVARDYARRVRIAVNEAANMARSTATVLSETKDPQAPMALERRQVSQILRALLEKHEGLLGVFTVWEPNAFDQKDELFKGQPGNDAAGRLSTCWAYDESGELVQETLEPARIKGETSFYNQARRSRQEVLMSPVRCRLHGRAVLRATYAVPIVFGDVFYGVVGVDLDLKPFQDVVDQAGLYSGKARVAIVAYDGTLVAVSNRPELAGKPLSALHDDWAEDLRTVQEGQEFTSEYDNNVTSAFSLFTPLVFGHAKTPWSINMFVPYSEINATTVSETWRGILLTVPLSVLSLLLLLLLSSEAVRPLGPIAKNAQAIAVGDLEVEDVQTRPDEIGAVNDGLRLVASAFREITRVCEAISLGDFSQSVQLRSDRDRLGRAINRMSETLRAVVRQANAIAQGDYSVEVTPQSEKDELGRTLAHMTQTLRRITSDNRRQVWLKTGQAELNERIRGELDTASMARNMITYLAQYLEAQVGAIYLARENGTLLLHGSYAYSRRKGLSNEYRPGEGLVGQAALENELLLIENVPEDYIAIRSGLGEASPRQLALCPLAIGGEVKGVVELGKTDTFTEAQVEFLRLVSESMAVAIHSAQSRLRVQELLEQTQQQAEELTAQQEELQQTNEELQERTHALEESEAHLQLQQEELQQTNEELEERTRALEEQRDQIQQSNIELARAQREIEDKARELENTSRFKSEFLANMSHELRTPLNSMLILSRVLAENKNGNLTEKQLESARTIHTAGSDLLKLINEILDLSKIEAGQLTINSESIRLADVLGDMERQFQHVAQEKGLAFRTEMAKSLPETIHSDPQRLEQILKNFLSNAFKFTEHGGVTLRIERPADQMRALAFQVTDTGIGIPRDKQQIIFQAFRQADGTTSRKYGGTGLGLSISTELARLLGGEIQLESAEAMGSCFRLILPEMMNESSQPQNEPALAPAPVTGGQDPAREGQSLPAAPVAAVAPAPSPVSAPPVEDDRETVGEGDKTVLIIEDDIAFARVVADLARKKGFKCLIAGDGESGLHLAETCRPSAVILDIGLPGVDGWGVMARLKESAVTRHIPVHFISGAERSLDAINMGAIGFLTKPVSMEMLDEALSHITSFISKPVKDLLVVAENDPLRRRVADIIGNGDVVVTGAETGQRACELLQSRRFDCMVIDLELPDMSGLDLLEKLRRETMPHPIPVVVYTGRELSGKELAAIHRLAESQPVKAVESPERLLDETSLFLHRIETSLPREQQAMLNLVHDKDAIFRGRKILLVDDDMRNIFALSSILEEKGMQVLIGKNGREGLERLNEYPDTALVLMDIMMPELDGYEAMRQIRVQARFDKLPIIALTAKAMMGDRNKCLEAGASDYLAKPVDVDKLFSLMRVWLYR